MDWEFSTEPEGWLSLGALCDYLENCGRESDILALHLLWGTDPDEPTAMRQLDLGELRDPEFRFREDELLLLPPAPSQSTP